MNEIQFLQGLLNRSSLDQLGRDTVFARILELSSRKNSTVTAEQELYKDVYVAAMREGKTIPSSHAENAVEQFRKFFNAS